MTSDSGAEGLNPRFRRVDMRWSGPRYLLASPPGSCRRLFGPGGVAGGMQGPATHDLVEPRFSGRRFSQELERFDIPARLDEGSQVAGAEPRGSRETALFDIGLVRHGEGPLPVTEFLPRPGPEGREGGFLFPGQSALAGDNP